MQYNKNKWRFRTIFLIVVVLLSGCTQDYLSDGEIVDEKVVALQEKDKELRLALLTGIESLRTKVLSTLTETDNRLNGEIDNSMTTLAQTVKTKMGEVNNFLNTELATRTTECNTKIGALNNSANNSKTSFETALATTKREVEQAIADGETERAAELNRLKNHYEKAVRQTDSISDKADEWKIRLQSILDMDYSTKFIAVESRLVSLESYQLDAKVDDLKQFLYSLSEEKLEELSMEDLNQFMFFMGETEERLVEARQLADDALMLADDIESTAEDAISDVERMMDNLESYLDDMFSELSGADLHGPNDMISDIMSRLDSFDGLITSLKDAADALGELMEMTVDSGNFSQFESSESTIESEIAHVETTAEICAEHISELFDLIEDWKDSHWWWDD